MKVVIMAGGKGTRISSVNSEVPKPMIPIINKPILEYQIEILKDQGFKDIIIVIGHLGKIIKDYFGDGSKISSVTGKSFGVNISYIEEKDPLGTAGALYLLKDKVKSDFLLLNGDIIFDIDIKRFYEFHKKKNSLATIFTHPNDHPYDSGIILTGINDEVLEWLHKEDKREWYKNRVNAGIHILSNKILSRLTELKKLDLDRDILKELISKKKIYAYDSPEYVKDMGTPDRLAEVTEDIRSGKVRNKNLLNKQKAIFIDRDGTINEYVGFLKDIKDFNLIEGVAEAIKTINKKGYLAIVVTNQPVIARGDVTFNELNEIHNKMETLLGKKGAYLDAIYFCPHHPHKGFENERPEYKIVCECRKPSGGMIFEALKDYNIDLENSWIIGDSISDMELGENVNCKTAFIGFNKNYESYKSLYDFVCKVIK